MSEIMWIEKDAMKGVKSAADVSVKIQKTNGKDRTGFIFRNQNHEKISHTDYMKVGIDDSKKRVYFAEGVVTTAYKIQGANGKARYVKIPAPLYDYVGNYPLRFDPVMEIYYIALEDREEVK